MIKLPQILRRGFKKVITDIHEGDEVEVKATGQRGIVKKVLPLTGRIHVSHLSLDRPGKYVRLSYEPKEVKLIAIQAKIDV